MVFDPVILNHKFLQYYKLKTFVEHIVIQFPEYFYQFDSLSYPQRQHLNQGKPRTPKHH